MNADRSESLVSEHELRELFRPRRTDASAFREGVARRIAEAERAQTTPEPKLSPWRSTLVRRAAAVLPPDVALAMFGGAKVVPSLLALPALLLALVVAAFAASARSLTRSTRDAAPATTVATPFGADPRLKNSRMAWGRGLMMLVQASMLLVMFAPFLVGGRHTVDVVIGVMILAMGALATTFSGFAQAGLLRRDEVAKLCAALLVAVFCGCFLWGRSFNLIAPDSELGFGWSALIVLTGFAICAVMSRTTSIAPRLYAGLVVASCVGAIVLLPPWATRSSDGALRGFLSEFAANPQDLMGWSEAGATIEVLRAVGAESPDLDHVRDAVQGSIARGEDLHPIVITVAARMGVIDREHWRLLAERKSERYRCDQLLTARGPFLTPWYSEASLAMLLATRELNESERVHLLERVEASWPDIRDNKGNDLEAVSSCLHAFDLLGRPELADQRRADVHEVLRRHWVSGERAGAFDVVGGFTSFPEMFSTSFADQTWTGTWLMWRMGVPEGIDLRLLRAHVHAKSLAFGLLAEPWASLFQFERASLAMLERGIGLPPRGWFAALFGERLLITTLLIVALCFVAIAKATPSGEAALARSRSGAMP